MKLTWFRHDTNAASDAKLSALTFDHGLEAYGLYWLVVELITADVSETNVTFALNHEPRMLGRMYNRSEQQIVELLHAMVKFGLLEYGPITEGGPRKFTCRSLGRRLTQSQTSSPTMRKIISQLREEPVTADVSGHSQSSQGDLGLQPSNGGSHDNVMTHPDNVMNREEKRREEERRVEERESAHANEKFDGESQSQNQSQSDQSQSKQSGRSDPIPHRLPDDFQLSASDIGYAYDVLGLVVDVQPMFRKFCNHHRANGSKRADWSAAWCKWVDDEKSYGINLPKPMPSFTVVDGGAGGESTRARSITKNLTDTDWAEGIELDDCEPTNLADREA